MLVASRDVFIQSSSFILRQLSGCWDKQRSPDYFGRLSCYCQSILRYINIGSIHVNSTASQVDGHVPFVLPSLIDDDREISRMVRDIKVKAMILRIIMLLEQISEIFLFNRVGQHRNVLIELHSTSFCTGSCKAGLLEFAFTWFFMVLGSSRP
jgi:hypothetical protein